MSVASLVLIANVAVLSCEYDDSNDQIEDVTVDVSGEAGVNFDARFEDDNHSQNASGVVPFTADFHDQEHFFSAEVDKNSGGSESVCLKVSTVHDSHFSKEECTSQPYGRVTVTLSF